MQNIKFDNPYNRKDFAQFVQNFLPDDFTPEVRAITDFNNNSNNFIQSAIKLGTCKSLELEVFEVTHTSTHDARVGLSKEAFKIMQKHSYVNRALYAFVPNDNSKQWRFSLLQIELEQQDKSARLTKNYSNPRRYSFLLGEGGKVRTPQQFLIDEGKVKARKRNTKDYSAYEDLCYRFSVEVLTKEFYKELFEWYQWALSDNMGVAYPNSDKNEEHLIRLITRLMFVWFIKQKKLIPEEIFEEEKLKEILVDFYSTSHTQGNYYNAVLQNLFFATLNRPINERRFASKSTAGTSDGEEHYGIKTLFRDDNQKTWFKKSHDEIVDLFRQVPFLNGGLFECLDKEKADNPKILYYDGFSRDERNISGELIRAFIPNCLFFDSERGLISILKKYNFTIEENTPNDVEVALDPELLGKVFENLLGVYNPETKETARKQSGSFYTPREIVNYMVDESLIAYLKQTVGEQYEDDFRRLFAHSVEMQDSIKTQIYNALQKCKILDPACGSGAFPMGILNRMMDIFKKIDPKVNLYQTKLDLIEKCIYGVDIQTIAIQISKLRFFISLIVEQTPNNNPNANFGILPLPNLESKFIAANTLIGLNEERKDLLDLHDEELILMKEELWNIRNHQNLRASSWQEKGKLREEDKDLCIKIENYLIKNAAKPDVEKIEQNKLLIVQYEKEIENLPEIWVDDYQKEIQMSFFGESKPKTLFRKDINKDKRDKITDRIKLLKAEITKEEKKKQLAGLEAEIKKMTSWNPYDQNASSPFFDAEWMFGLTKKNVGLNAPNPNGYFDIVIGNPPYLKEGRISKMLFEQYKSSPYYQGKMDLWYMFACKGIDFLKSNGLLCFIATNNWVTSFGASKLRNKVITDTQIKQLIDFSNFMIFESASIQTMVMLFLKENSIDNYMFDYRKLAGDTILADALDLLSKNANNKANYLFPKIVRNDLKGKFLTFSSNDTILIKITEKSTYFIEKEVAQGIVFPQDFLNRKNQSTLGNNYFVGQGIFALTNEEKDNLKLFENELNLIKPYYTTEQIHRYYSNPESKLWLIYTDSSFRNPRSMDNYPNLKRHLDKFSNVITSDNKPYGLHRTREEQFFKGEKIIVQRKCVGQPSFSYSDFDCYVSATFFVIKTNRFNLKYLTGLLNSKLIAFWLRNKGKMQGNNYQIDKEPLLQIPIFKANTEQQQSIIVLVNQILSIKRVNPVADTSDLERRIDKLVYHFYNLTDEEVAIIEE